MAKRDYIDYLGLKRFKENFDTDLAKKVDVTTYNTKVAALEEKIANVSTTSGEVTKENLDTLGVVFEEDIASLVTMDDVLAKVGGAYHYKGSKASLNELLADVTAPEVGDVYNLEDTGMNAAWTGEAWDELGSAYDLSEYLTKEDVTRITEDEIDELFRKIITSETTLAEGGLMTIDSDVTVTSSVNIKTDSNLKLTGSLTPVNEIWADNNVAILQYSGAENTHTISGTGTLNTIENDSYGIHLVGGILTIEGDVTIQGNITCVQVQEGTCYIKGGNYELQQLDDTYGTGLMLNIIDSARKAGTAAIIVTGGRFKNFDPSAGNVNDGSFVPDGYTVTSEVVGEDTYYTVTKV